ncbi:MAG: glycosyltransferase, partial [Bacteroidales bacterium]|nr:glycosyltransferase [Bacteroidales bacterium]
MGDKIRVLSVSTSDSSGGAARAAYRIHKAVQAEGIDSRMFVKDKGTEDPDVLALPGFIPTNPLYKAFDWVRNKVKNKWQHYQWGKYPDKRPYFMSDLRSTDIGGALQKLDYDILHLHWVNLRFLPLDQLPKDKPIVWTLHDSWPFCGVCHVPIDCTRYQGECGCCPQLGSAKMDDLSHQVWADKQRMFKDLDLHVVAPSHWLADCARKSSLFRDCDIRVIPNCLDTDTFCPGDRVEACRRFGLDPERRHILFGAMQAVEDKNKGFDYLVNALEQIGPELSADTDLVVFGTSKPIAAEIGDLQVSCIGLLTNQEDIVRAYRTADVTVVPSLSENLSCTIMESMACGTPVVAFAIGGNADLIDHQVNGYLAHEKDCEDLAQGIRW